LIAGARALRRKLRRYRPGVIAFLGVTAYRTAFQLPKATIGKQEERIEDVPIWVLPNPSGLNAHFQIEELAALFATLRESLIVEAPE
jgi:TDG/mug DNA glycosylase family protein